ncbi:PepSY-associated TM helix domain-containing protein [Tardiphaga sp.]|jgi:uncharacterized iron-regulated membrane protein|uniref:PepSY-associated TM helix domain-containing protein n=1 Tax=Tardiphaga sp. TaxID=1926292 RepID=UPI0037DA2813
MASARSLRIWAFVHTWTSIISMVFMLMLCVTGLPLIFHHEIDELFEEHVVAPKLSEDIKPKSTDEVIAAARRLRPADHVLLVNWREDSPAVVVVAMSETPIPVPGMLHRIQIDARTLSVLGEEPAHFGVMDVILKIHKDMYLGLPGELFLGFMGLLLVAAIISGIVVYAPFMRRLDFGTIRRRQSPRVTWLDLHNLTGAATIVWLLVVGFTGSMNTLAIPLYDLWRGQLLPVLLQPYRGMPVATPSAIDEAIARVRGKLPDTTVTSVTMPTSARFGSPQHLVVWTKGTSPLTARLLTPVLVAMDGSLNVIVPEMPWYLRALQTSRPLHFGDYGGLPLKILWALLDVIAIIVLVSGIYLWFAKRKFGGGLSREASRHRDESAAEARAG